MTETTEVYFEIIPNGRTVKIVAIDAISGTEAVTFAPAGTATEILKKTALDKLKYILNKKNTDNNQ